MRSGSRFQIYSLPPLACSGVNIGGEGAHISMTVKKHVELGRVTGYGFQPKL